jgi:hypothetical protein
MSAGCHALREDLFAAGQIVALISRTMTRDAPVLSAGIALKAILVDFH